MEKHGLKKKKQSRENVFPSFYFSHWNKTGASLSSGETFHYLLEALTNLNPTLQAYPAS